MLEEVAKTGTVKTEETSYVDTRVATNRFNIEGGEARIICWGDTHISTIEMDGGEFETDELTAEIIHQNLDDGQFGCERIVGARYLTVTQIYTVTRKSADGSTREFEDYDYILDGNSIEKLEDGSVVIEDF